MSESYGGGYTAPTGGESSQPSGTVETAKNEAGEVASTATHEAGHVVETAKNEAAAVAGEAKTQVKDLYTQTQGELKEQAGVQQQRVAEGLRSVGEELESMVQTSENPGIAADLVQQVSTRVSGAATWIGDRDPGSLLSEVTSYARRKPGTFIAAAALTGLVVGRLTRALADNAADDKKAAAAAPSVPATTPAAPVPVVDVPPVPAIPSDLAGGAPVGGTPLYDQSRATWDEVVTGEGSGDVRRDSV
ncbi:hypothetical protein ACFXP7_13085 [Microbacterium sp. P06]|uniref:hypothetical protein n=1 Tax=Microbacterium sp. P06 TaxID=3366949 RepID=UPI0037473825